MTFSLLISWIHLSPKLLFLPWNNCIFWEHWMKRSSHQVGFEDGSVRFHWSHHCLRCSLLVWTLFVAMRFWLSYQCWWPGMPSAGLGRKSSSRFEESKIFSIRRRPSDIVGCVWSCEGKEFLSAMVLWEFCAALIIGGCSGGRKQLHTIVNRYKLDVCAVRNSTKVRNAIASGFFFHAAIKDPQQGDQTLLENQPVYIHCSSSVFQRQLDWVMYNELVTTSREYMREVTVIDPRWLVELAPRFCRFADTTNMSKRKRQEIMGPLYDRYREPNYWRLSKRRA